MSLSRAARGAAFFLIVFMTCVARVSAHDIPRDVTVQAFAKPEGHSFKLLGLGPLIGKRTWGGVIGFMRDHRLVDGTLITEPEYSFWFKDVGWGLENYGTEPDIEVEIAPQDYASGADPQLERAVVEALNQLENLGYLEPKPGERPGLGRER